MDIDNLLIQAGDFRKKLGELKRLNPPEGFSWYGYDILGNLSHLQATLTGKNRLIFEASKGKTILDVGAADGDFAFFLESLGHDVEVMDLPVTNWNGLKGAYRLKELLGSKVEIRETNVDGPFELNRTYGLVLFLGILYHLRNPMLALESFARSCEFMALSTRVARYAPDGKTRLDDLPVAYFLDPRECNNDATNWWIFSRPALRRLVQRAGWTILDEASVGDAKASNPVAPEHDERVFMLLRSNHIRGSET